MRLLDLFCGAGGAAMGYYRAGFDEIVGIDIEEQSNYPFEFIMADALKPPVNLETFDLIHASPPCQFHSIMRKGRWQDRDHPEMIMPTREMLVNSGVPYVIENVSGARSYLTNPIMLCGTMFGLETKSGSQLRRHRYFELSFYWGLTPSCRHNKYSAIGVYGGGQNPSRKKIPPTIGVYGHAGGSSERDGTISFRTQDRRDAMDIQWMTGKELSEAIPPAYTKWIGEKFFETIFERI